MSLALLEKVERKDLERHPLGKLLMREEWQQEDEKKAQEDYDERERKLGRLLMLVLVLVLVPL